MRGRVLNYSDAEARGLISGDDGTRYPFVRGALADGLRTIRAGADVDFEVEHDKAVNIYPLPGASVLGEKNRIVAAVLAFFLGSFGVHKFYLGKTGAGLIMLAMGTIGWILVLPGLAALVIAFLEFIVYLIKTDQQFYEDYVIGNREWF
jgi:TM2 domain-containing membrane protein YozV/cold shock CspA family protein